MIQEEKYAHRLEKKNEWMNDNKKKNCGEWNELRVSGNLLKGKKIIKQLTNTTRPSSS